MAKRRHHEEFELPFVALMDTMTNVVGVLVIVLVMVGISMASAVKKVLSDLPSVDQATFDMAKNRILTSDVKTEAQKIADAKKALEDKLKKTIEELKTLDVEVAKKNIKVTDLSDIQAKIDAQKKLRDEQKLKMEALLAELDRLKIQLDTTPIYQPPASTYVRLPNPRPYPEKPNETKVLVAQQGVLFFNEKAFMTPITEGLEKLKVQFEYKEVKIDPFLKLLETVYGSASTAQQAWPEIGAFANTFQMESVAQAHKSLVAAGLTPNKNTLQSIGDISVAIGQQMPVVADAIVAATKGNYLAWTKLDTSKDPTKPNIKATANGGKVSFTWGAKTIEVKASPKDVLNYFIKDLAEMDGFKNRSKAKVIYDSAKLVQVLERAASNPALSGSYVVKPLQPPGATNIQLALTPKPGGGERLETMKDPASNYQRLLRQIKGDPAGVAVFQVLPDAFATYLEGRKIADETGVPATWDFLAKLDLTINVPVYEVQRFTPAPIVKPLAPGAVPPVTIAAPKKGLD